MVQLADIESIGQTVDNIIKDDSLCKVDLNHFLIGWLKVLQGKRPDGEDIVHVVIMSSALTSYHVLDHQIEGEASWELLSWKEKCFLNSNLETIMTCWD